MTRPGVTAYLQTMFVQPGERGGGVGAALVRHAHGVLDAAASRPRCCTTRR
jgi:GNAT superfamily N-acetyltransferase